MMLTPEQNRLDLAYCDILNEMDSPLSYTMQDNRYGIWVLWGISGEFNRVYVAMSFEESERFIRDYYSEGNLVLLVPHVQLDACAAFLADLVKAGQQASSFIERAGAAAELPPEPSKAKAKPKAKASRKAVAK